MPAAGRRPIPGGIRALLAANFLNTVAYVGLITFLGDQVFSITGRELDLGLLALAVFVPVFVFSPIGGTVADRMDRRYVYAAALAVQIGAAATVFLYGRSDPDRVWPFFVCMAVYGAARAFAAPASRSMPIDLAPTEVLERVIALKALAFQSGVIVGPVMAGFAAVVAVELPYLISTVLLTVALALLVLVPKAEIERLETPSGPLQAFADAVDGSGTSAATPSFSVRSASTSSLYFSVGRPHCCQRSSRSASGWGRWVWAGFAPPTALARPR